MNNLERYEYFINGNLQKIIQISLLDWVGYWSTLGTNNITDPLLKKQTEKMIDIILTDGGFIVEKVSRLAISDNIFKQKTAEEITDNDIKLVNDSIMTNKLSWLTNINNI